MKKAPFKPVPPYLDAEEKEAIEALHKAMDDETLVSRLTPERQKELQAAARNTLNPPKKHISIRLAEGDLVGLKARALKQGVPYQTLLSSIVHQFVAGTLVEKK